MLLAVVFVAARQESCDVSLTRQTSQAPCVKESTYGAEAKGEVMWVTSGCRGKFDCCGRPTSCGFSGGKSGRTYRCSCAAQFVAGKSCAGLYVDVGANNGDSLQRWFQLGSCSEPLSAAASQAAPCMWQLPTSLPLAVRQTYCAHVFEPNPRHWSALQAGAEQFRAQGRSVHVHKAAFGAHSGSALFGLDTTMANSEGSSLLLSKRTRDRTTGAVGKGEAVRSNTINVTVSDGVAFLRRLGEQGLPVVLKLDVEAYEFVLLRSLLASGVLCQTVSELFVEWHAGRFSWEESGLPAPSETLERVYRWMLGNATKHCKTTILPWY